MLITDNENPLLAKSDINCFKVMVNWDGGFYVCPPAFQYYLLNNELIRFTLGTVYETGSNDISKDYRKDWYIGEWFYHTFCDLESAKHFVNYMMKKLKNPESTKRSELYKIPQESELVILNALIPKWSLYYKWNYKEIQNERTYASNKIIYKSIYSD